MREVRIYQPGYYQVGQLIELSSEAGQHVGVVLRMQPGQHLTLFCGDNQEFNAEIISVAKKKVWVKILTCHEVNRESPCSIHLAQAISKGERMEMVVQKAVELGVASITPLITERCAVKLDAARLEKKRLQWQAIAIAACEQSGRNKIPPILPIISLKQYLDNPLPALKLVLSPTGKKTLSRFDQKLAEIGLVIGPEGGLSLDELDCLDAQQFLPLSLGPRILRTETAAIVALSVLQAICGDL
ncbi:16S rRNA methyltransferase [Legionella beliardensis]|uniref:Ribosomal RNA small subunit methyltransferase E n=1 Tax=Legionella beliardensis TaxID=91822 RepID=A0A378HXG2_9GAMM|nr:16S rRNA (uracil(1498)-N(3))-methyltransferase [Legionella beliardensis]STX27512.1 16S rRNA methyltransferase [Legionella beliardensis]